jgi:bleomycin hydrolase
MPRYQNSLKSKKMKKVWIVILGACLSLSVVAQDDLVNKSSSNAVETTDKYTFTTVVDLDATSVKNQASSGTCWSYAAVGFVESEMMRMGKDPIDISEMYVVRMAYLVKARKYVRVHGKLNFAQGGEAPDIFYVLKNYGAMPQEAYSGLNYGTDVNKHGELETALKAYLDAIIQNKNGQLSTAWESGFTAILDAYLGAVPEEFDWNGKKYTPRSFADDVIGLNPDDYVTLTSFTHHPFYEPFILELPDNWMWSEAYNLPIDEFMGELDNALNNGYSVAWATDVSEKGFSVRNGLAVMPAKDWREMSAEEQKQVFNGPHEELEVTQEMRQVGFDNYSTQDDHGMQITGIVTDQTGARYYITKNSWGDISNPYKEGYVYASEAFVKYKTISFLVHKDALTKATKKKLYL